MHRFGIEFERSFDLTPKSVKRSIDDNIRVSFYDNRVLLDMANARKKLGYVPLKKGAEIDYEASSPLVAVLRQGSRYRVSYGNRRITELHPQFFEYDSSRHFIGINVDGQRKAVGFGRVVEANAHVVCGPGRRLVGLRPLIGRADQIQVGQSCVADKAERKRDQHAGVKREQRPSDPRP